MDRWIFFVECRTCGAPIFIGLSDIARDPEGKVGETTLKQIQNRICSTCYREESYLAADLVIYRGAPMARSA